jgi:uncharacterized SAM-binding protein YcdF (DUF218 family)
VISKLVAFAVSPLGTFLLAVLIGWILMRLTRSRTGRRLGAGVMLAGLAWLVAWSMPIMSDALRGAIEDRAGPRNLAAVKAAPVAVVLGGGMEGAEPPRRLHPDLGSAADRVWHAARLYRAGKVKSLVVSGGSFRAGGALEAPAMRELLLELGVPDRAILLESESRTTGENARLTAAMLSLQGVREIVLVTSALHMSRARREFERLGLTVHPAPTDWEVVDKPFDLLRVVPSTDALDGSSRALKELVGLAATYF